MLKPFTSESVLPHILLVMTVVTGLIDAVSYLALDHVFTANMTGNIVLLGFASTGVPEVSVSRSITALLGFLSGAVVGGRMMAGATATTQIRAASSVFLFETVLLIGAATTAFTSSSDPSPHFPRLYAIIVLTAIAMGLRNAAVRKLAVPDLTTTVLTLTITGLAADSSLAKGNNPRWLRRIIAVLSLFAGAALGSLALRHSMFAALCIGVAASVFCSCVLQVASRLSTQP
jgi:uncharacterized membrane protein YoaK (UPF0700 family)